MWRRTDGQKSTTCFWCCREDRLSECRKQQNSRKLKTKVICIWEGIWGGIKTQTKFQPMNLINVAYKTSWLLTWTWYNHKSNLKQSHDEYCLCKSALMTSWVNDILFISDSGATFFNPHLVTGRCKNFSTLMFIKILIWKVRKSLLPHPDGMRTQHSRARMCCCSYGCRLDDHYSEFNQTSLDASLTSVQSINFP